MNGGITYWPYTNTCLVETWGNTRYIYIYIYICLIPSSIPGLYLPHNYNSVFDPISGSCWYESLLKKDPISKTRLVIKVVFKYPIPGPDSYVQKMIPVEHWFTLLCFEKRIFCVCFVLCVCVCVFVGKDSVHDISNTYWANEVFFLPYFGYLFSMESFYLSCYKTDVQSISIPRTPPHPPATSSDKQTNKG